MKILEMRKDGKFQNNPATLQIPHKNSRKLEKKNHSIIPKNQRKTINHHITTRNQTDNFQKLNQQVKVNYLMCQ